MVNLLSFINLCIYIFFSKFMYKIKYKIKIYVKFVYLHIDNSFVKLRNK